MENNFIPDPCTIGLCPPADNIVDTAIVDFEKIENPNDKKYFSHAFFVVDMNISVDPQNITAYQRTVIEALASGVKATPFVNTSYYNDPNIVYLVPKESWNNIDKTLMQQKAINLIGHPYYFLGTIIFQPIKILINKFWPSLKKHSWWGLYGKGSDKTEYCSELVTISVNAGSPGFFDETNSYDPQQLFDYPKLKIINN